MVNRGGPLPLQDNARLHTSQITRRKLTHLSIEVPPLPPYSSRPSSTDCRFFLALDSHLRQKKFTMVIWPMLNVPFLISLIPVISCFTVKDYVHYLFVDKHV